MTLLGCPSIDPTDPFDSLTTVANDDTTGDGDGDQTGDGDGDDQTGDGDGDQTGDGDGDDTDTDGECGNLGEACSGETCCAGLSCQPDGTCGIGGGDGDGDDTDGTPMWGDGPYFGQPPACQPEEMPIGVQGIEGGFCAPSCMCTDAMCTNADACPPAPGGSTAQPQCALDDGMGGAFCALICMVEADPDQCPAGATCKDLMNAQFPGIGMCTYP
ncbi:MAG: hypothetical protein R6X02_06370 [Enhygromyxa sp.]